MRRAAYTACSRCGCKVRQASRGGQRGLTVDHHYNDARCPGSDIPWAAHSGMGSVVPLDARRSSPAALDAELLARAAARLDLVRIAVGEVPLGDIRTRDLEGLVTEALGGAEQVTTTANAQRLRDLERQAWHLRELVGRREVMPMRCAVVIHVDFRERRRIA